MPGTLPDGDPVPADGSLPPSAAARYGQQAFGVYVHVPFCRTRCGYCDFNTYTATELGGGASQDAYPDLIAREIALAEDRLVFFGNSLNPGLLTSHESPRVALSDWSIPGRVVTDLLSAVEKLDENQIRARLQQLEAEKVKRTEANKTRLANLTPEQKEARNAKAKEYREANAEKWKASRQAYNTKPEVVERRKLYMKKRNAERTALYRRAKELGITA